MRKFLYSQPDNAVLYDTELCKTAYQLYNILVEMSDKKTNEVTVEVRILAERLGRADITTRRHLSTLVRCGIIIRKFNKSKTNPKINEASTFTVVGRHAVRYKNSEYAGDYPSDKDQKRQEGTVKNDIQKQEKESLRESLESNLTGESKIPENSGNSDNSPAIESSATPKAPAKTKNPETPKTSNQTVEFDLSGVPDIMQGVARYLLLRTGRPYLTDNEKRIIREILDKQHMPARVIKEIDKAYDRFINDPKRNIHQLTFNYIGECLRDQESRKSRTTPRTRNVEISQAAPEITNAQEALPDISYEIMPIEEAERVISEYTPAVKEADEGISVALQELYERMNDREEDKRTKSWEQGVEEPFTLEEYLQLKFPEADEEELRRDYDGNVHEDYSDFPAIRRIEKAFDIDFACAFCTDPKECRLPSGVVKGREYPATEIFTNAQGQKCLGVKTKKCLKCKFRRAQTQNQPSPEFERLMKSCGLSEKQREQTFTNYAHEGMPEEIVSAKAKAILAAKNGTSLILAGKAGTGKTHLATAIAIEAMRLGKRAIIISVPAMLDKLREAAREKTSFMGTLQWFREVPCLVLDDWGKEKTTQAGMDYLYQIIDYRYQRGMQTIATTNALDMNGLVNPWNADKIEPLVSRIVENGEWVTIRNAKNHRLSKKPLKLSEPKDTTPELPAETAELYVKIKEHDDKLLEQSNAYYDSLPRDEDDCIVFPDDIPDFCMTLEEYLRLKFPEAEEEELRTDYSGTVHENYSSFSEHRKMEKAFRIDEACANCTDPENCGLPFGICKGLRYPVILRKKNPQGKWCLCVEYAEELICKHNCGKCAVKEAVKVENSQRQGSVTEPKADNQRKAEQKKKQEETNPVDFTSALGMRVSFDDEGDITSSPQPKKESEPGTWEADPYELEVIERDRKIAEYQKYLREQEAANEAIERERRIAEYTKCLQEQKKAEEAKAQAERLGMNDDDLWSDDEDEYDLPGDSRYRKHDRDEDHEAGV